MTAGSSQFLKLANRCVKIKNILLNREHTVYVKCTRYLNDVSYIILVCKYVVHVIFKKGVGILKSNIILTVTDYIVLLL